METAFWAALDKAREFVGATAPNPPVGAVAIDSGSHILSLQAHQRAGQGHAEAKVIVDLREQGRLGQVHTLFVTLEPCNHQGRTPPCTEAIVGSGIRRVIYGTRDPNPKVAGQGAERLRQAGIEVTEAQGKLSLACQKLIRPFAYWARTGRPWVVLKTAQRMRNLPLQQSMIPPPGHKTFTSASSLKLAHELRRQADAILTGSGTVLADLPEFTVRHVPDHAIVASGEKKRRLVVLDRRHRIPKDWIAKSESRGFEVWVREDLESTLDELGKAGVLEVLVEAGPELSSFILQNSLWNEHVLITAGNPDTVEILCSLASSNTSLASPK
jgi:diaminohydroxyphosphoribosylaminopyrimidine deaminase/5-amino-6-(5-phosphoribosylamino)uracil reductase